MDAETRLSRRLVFAAVAFGVLGAIVVTSRTARVRNARVVRATADDRRPTTGERNAISASAWGSYNVTVALDYSAGSRPQYVIVDVFGAPGSGSATIEGENDEVEIPLSGPLGDGARIEVTASTRVFGRLRTRRIVFGG